MTAYSPDPRDLGPAGAAGRARAPAAGHGDDDAATLARGRGSPAGTARQAVPDLDADEILSALSDDVMAEGDLAEALRRLHGARLAQRATRPDRTWPACRT